MSKKAVLTRKAAITMGALVGFLKPKLAQDAVINFYPILGTLTSKNFKSMKPKIVEGIKKQTEGKLAKDASIDGLIELLDGMEKVETGDALETEPNAGLPLPVKKEGEGEPPPMEGEMGEGGEEDEGLDADVHAGLRAFLEEKGLSPEDVEAACAMVGENTPGDAELGTEHASEEGEDAETIGEKEGGEMAAAKDKKGAKDEPPPFKGKPEVGGGMSQDAVNKAIKLASDAAVDNAVKQVKKDLAAVREAERFVRPWVGDLAMAHDSAEGVFKTALTALGVDIAEVHPSAYKAILAHVPVPSDNPKVTVLGQDSAFIPSNDFATRFPEAAKVKFA